jgi:chaperonin GroEL (HSP60 family)
MVNQGKMSPAAVSMPSESLRRELTFDFVLSAAKSLTDIFRSSYGPKGTYKMYSLSLGYANIIG